MLLVVTSAFDPALPFLQAEPRVAILVPAHLSQPGIEHETLRGEAARLITSRGLLCMGDVDGVVTCIARVAESELPHVHADDRAYVAAEMTAFLASLLSELRCPLFNRPTGAHLGGLSWTAQHAWRVAKEEGIPFCASLDCREVAHFVALDFEPLPIKWSHEEGHRAHFHARGAGANDASGGWLGAIEAQIVRRISRRAGVRLLQVELCLRHGGLRNVSPSPALDATMLEALCNVCGARR
jgi:hypothetical protein